PTLATTYRPRHLTVKLSGRPEVPRARQSAITLSAHEAPTHPTVHGPLQRLLEVRPHRLPLCACGAVAATAADRAPVCSAPSWQTELLRAWRAAPQARTAAQNQPCWRPPRPQPKGLRRSADTPP